MMNTKIWIDTASFQDFGTWKLDTQFTHIMGSAYLLACHSPGTPVEDATTKFDVPEQKHYRVWVRARNWYYSHSPGKFEISIDDKTSGTILGELMSNDWVWQIAGDFELSKGTHTLKLHDLTGYFGRCSSIVITDDMEYIPARPVDEFEKDRAETLGISLEPTDEGEYDLLVAGAGPGGIPAAIMAARMGSKVLLISNRPVLGGNASVEGGVNFDGASARHYNAKNGGIVEEILRIKYYNSCRAGEAVTILCEQEKNITIVYNQHVVAVETENSVIKSATTRDTLKGTRHKYKAKIFVDATGDSWLGYFAGAKYRIGREANWQYGEEFAPQNADLLTMSGTVMGIEFTDSGSPAPFTRPEWATKLKEGEGIGRNIEKVGAAWWGEAPNVLDDLYDGEIARDEIFRVYVSYFDYLKNSWQHKERTVNHVFAFMNHINKKRESRRLIGDYTLTQNDCMEGKDFKDTVAHAGWPIDLHHPEGIYSGEEGPFFSNTHVPLVKIPFRCLYSKNIENLMMVGRNTSVTHVALGTARLQGTIGSLAQAVGIAANMCVNQNINPKEVGEKHIAELQELLLKWDGYIPNMQSTDEKDLARNCKVTASSESKTERYTGLMGKYGDVLPMDRQRASFLAREVSPLIPSIWLLLTNETDKEIPLTLHFREQADPDGYTTETDIKTVTSIVPASGEHWVKFDCDLNIDLRYFWIYADKTEGLGWRMMTFPPLDFTRSERMSEDERFENFRGEAHCVIMHEPVDLKANCSAENVINGYSRIENAEHYEWVSDENETLPQWICLEPQKPSEMNSVHITFDTDMTNPPMAYRPIKMPEQLVRDYSVEILVDGNWKCIAKEKHNIFRKKVHNFEPAKVEKIRINIIKTADEKTARVFEVRLYNN
ncbi:MAG: FAD-dependent oxidoreductase [Clostridia bacterium]